MQHLKPNLLYNLILIESPIHTGLVKLAVCFTCCLFTWILWESCRSWTNRLLVLCYHRGAVIPWYDCRGISWQEYLENTFSQCHNITKQLPPSANATVYTKDLVVGLLVASPMCWYFPLPLRDNNYQSLWAVIKVKHHDNAFEWL